MKSSPFFQWVRGIATILALAALGAMASGRTDPSTNAFISLCSYASLGLMLLWWWQYDRRHTPK